MISCRVLVCFFMIIFDIIIFLKLANTLSKNTEQRQMHFGHSQNMAVLSRQLQDVHTEKDRQITTTLTRMSLQEQAMLKANK
jgi:hypothetical protein